MGKQAYFDENLGRKNGTLLGGVDSEFVSGPFKMALKCIILAGRLLNIRF